MIDQDENAARIAGICAMLALPMVRCADGRQRKRVVQIEYRPGLWEQIDGVEVKADTLLFYRRRNGTTIRFEVPASRCPRWRVDRAESSLLIDDDDPRPMDAR